MHPILNRTSEWQRARALGRRGVVLLALFLGLGVAQADTTDFTGDFATDFWSLTAGGFGSVYFTNSGAVPDTLVLAGPAVSPPGGTSVDGILYNHPLGGGLAVGGTVSFHWVYNPGDSTDPVQGDVRWGDVTPPSFVSGSGAGQFGDFTSPLISPGTTNLTFLLTSTPQGADKLSATLIITDFQFHDIPEPPTGVILAGVGMSLGAACWRRSRGQASSRP
jgi:hypothetical protein